MLDVVERVDKSYIQTFMRVAMQVAQNKLYFDKVFLKTFDVMEECLFFARQYLGKDVLFLQDEAGFRLYISDMFGSEKLRDFENAFGDFVSDYEHGLLFYYNLQAEQHPKLDVALGLLYYLLGVQLQKEFGAIAKLTQKNLISPIFELHPQFFRWKRCNYVLRKYMLPMGHMDGYNSFYFEKAHLAQILYLVHHGMSFVDAESHVKSMEGGLLLSNLPPSLENALMPYILSCGFHERSLTGYYGPTLVKDMTDLSKSYNLSEVYNVFNMAVKPRLIEHTGRVLGLVLQEFESSGQYTFSDFMIHHITPNRIGVRVREGLELKDILPNLHVYFKPVEPLDLKNVLSVEFL